MSKDLVGRPLVPYFDKEDEVNVALTPDKNQRHEQMDVDARVWNREKGYFEYPSTGTSSPVAIQAPASNSSMPLLTPQLLVSRSAPEFVNNIHSHGMEMPTPTKSTSSPNSPLKKTGNAKAEATGTPRKRKQPRSRNGTPCKNQNGKKAVNKPCAKDDLSANGKWAWSAFQSSPEPDQLPLPSFVSNNGAGGNNKGGERKDGMLETPEMPPEIGHVEVEMTQDLRRMLNIGGHG